MQFSKDNSYRSYFTDSFGIPADVIEKYDFYVASKSVWAFTGNYVPEYAETAGIRALRISRGLKPTTAFLRIVGMYATRNVILLDNDSAPVFLRGDTINSECGNTRGYVVVRTRRDVLGCGLCTEKGLISQVPKKYRPADTWL